MEISGNPFVAAVLFWTELERQVRIEGKAVKLSGEESAEYFNSRPFESRISAAVSPQSREIPDRKYLEEKFESYRKSLKNENVPRPENWGGFLIIPDKIEFWQGRENRLHDRILYTKNGENWAKLRLAP